MLERYYHTPWKEGRATAARLEAHCAMCRVMELPYSAAPAVLGAAMAIAAPALAAQARTAGATAYDGAAALFSFFPPGYIPDPPNPWPAIGDGTADHIAVWGGRGSGKSHGAGEAVIEAASVGKERVCAAREYMARIKESSKELLEAKIKESEWAADWEVLETELRNTRTGSVIFFVGLNGLNAESVGKSLEGVTILWCDEAQLLTQQSIDVMLPTIRDAASRMIWTWNPSAEPSPVDELFRGPELPERAKVTCLLVEHNPYLYQSRLASEMRSSASRDKPTKFQHIWRGAHLEVSDATVLDNIEQAYIDWSLLPDGGREVLRWAGMDFGYGGQDPTAATSGFFIPAQSLPGYKPEAGFKPILYIDAEAKEQSVPNHELHKMARAVGAKHIICDSANPLMIEAINGVGGVSASAAKKGPGSVLADVNKLQSCRIIVAPYCTETWDELKGIRWKTDKKTGKVVRPLALSEKPDDHLFDSIRYGISQITITEVNGVIYL